MKAQRKAFTLIELLVVVAIITLLISILLPSLSAAREQSKRAKCLANLRSFGAANSVYASEWDGWYMPLYQNDPIAPTSAKEWTWYKAVEVRNAFGIPQRVGAPNRWPRNLMCPNATMALDAGTAEGVQVGSVYGYNVTSMRAPTWQKTVSGSLYFRGIKSNAVTRPADAFAFADALDYQVSTSWASGISATSLYIVNGWQEIRPSWQHSLIAYRHSHGANVSYFDGHAEWLPYQKLMLVNPPGGLVPALSSKQLGENARRWDYAPVE